MARPRQQSSRPDLTPGQASYVLERLVIERRVSASDVARYVNDMQREIEQLQQRLESLREASGSARLSIAKRATAGRRRARPAVSAERKASQMIQGRYLGLIRQIPKTRRAQYQRIAKEKGREAAIREMSSALGR